MTMKPALNPRLSFRRRTVLLGCLLGLSGLSVGHAAATDLVRFDVATSNNSVARGSTGDQTIVATNSGPNAATGVVVTYTPPTTAGITVNSVYASPGGSCTLTSGKWVCPSVASVAVNGTVTLTVNISVAASVAAGTTAGSTTSVNSNEFNPGSGTGESLFNIWGATGTSAAIGDAFWFAFDGKYDTTGNKVEGTSNEISSSWPPAQANPPGPYNTKADTAAVNFYTNPSNGNFSAPYGTTNPTTQPAPKVKSVVTSPPTVTLSQIVVNGSAANQARDNRRVWEIRTGIYLNAAAPLFVCVGQPDDGMYVAIDDNVVAKTNIWNSGIVNSSGATYAAGYHDIVYRIVNRNDQKDSWEGGAAGFASLGIGSTAATCTPSSYNTFTQVAPATNLTVTSLSMSGTVYEDYNYGGGMGRAYNASQGMSARPNARVELYNKTTGAFVASTITDASGVYSFSGLSGGSYTVRVVNSTVTSSRTGYVAGLLPVQTYVNGNAAKVGGEAPALADAAANTTSAAYSTLNTTTTAAESIADINLTTNVIGVDFGFNFDTVVNTNPSGQGSLAQFVTNSNALKNTGLAQAGSRSRDGVTEALPAATETSIFMIPTSALTSGVAVITMPDGATSTTSVLPAVTDTFTSIDGTTQTVNIGDTNTGLVGTGGTVGYLTTATLTQVPRPEVQIQGPGRSNTSTTAGFGLVLNANNSTLRGISIFGFGAHNDSQGAVSVNTANDSLLEQNLFGMAATSAMCTSSTTATGVGSGVLAQSSLRGTLQHNILSCNGGNGAHIYSGTSAWTIVNNEFRANAMNTGNLDGLDLSSGSSGNTVRGNLFIDNHANGLDTYAGGGSNTYESNTVKNNGMTGDGNNEIPGIRIYSKNNVIRYNLIQDNYGSGILVVNSAVGNTSNYLTGNLISKNSISGNGTDPPGHRTGRRFFGRDLLQRGHQVAVRLVGPQVRPDERKQAPSTGGGPAFSRFSLSGSGCSCCPSPRPRCGAPCRRRRRTCRCRECSPRCARSCRGHSSGFRP